MDSGYVGQPEEACLDGRELHKILFPSRSRQFTVQKSSVATNAVLNGQESTSDTLWVAVYGLVVSTDTSANKGSAKRMRTDI